MTYIAELPIDGDDPDAPSTSISAQGATPRDAIITLIRECHHQGMGIEESVAHIWHDQKEWGLAPIKSSTPPVFEVWRFRSHPSAPGAHPIDYDVMHREVAP